MSSNTKGYLTKCTYLPVSREVVVEFSSTEGKRSFRYSYFPKFYVPLDCEGKVREVMQECKSQQYRVSECDNKLEVEAGTFEHLETLAKKLVSKFGIFPLLLSAERQFLIIKGWGYFDGFEIFDDGVERVAGLRVPDIEIDFLCGEFQDAIEALLIEDKLAAESILEKMVLSNFLKIDIRNISGKDVAEGFLELVYFEQGLLGSRESREEKIEKAGVQIREGMSEVDFTNIWANMLTGNLNIGPETIKCACCEPSGFEDDNIVDSSLVNVEFNIDGFFYTSDSEIWGSGFHNEKPGKGSRVAQKLEWFFDRVPVGPFNRRDVIKIPLADAKRLVGEGRIDIADSGHELVWVCKKGGVLSNAVKDLTKLVTEARVKRSAIERKVRSKGGLMVELVLEACGDYNFYKVMIEQLNLILSKVYLPFVRRGSFFHNTGVADALLTGQSAIIRSFKDFATEKCSGNFSSGGKVFVEQKNALSVAKAFAATRNVPEPSVSGVI